MAINLNKQNPPIFDEWMMKHETPGAPEITIQKLSDGTEWKSRQVNLFANIDTQKTIVGYLKSIGLDPFKKGTKEPIKIKEALDKVDWETIKDGPKGGQSMFDQGESNFNSHVSRLFTKDLETSLINNQEDNPEDSRPFVARFFNASGVGTWLIREIGEYRMKKGEEYKAVRSFKERIELQEQGYIIDDVIVYGFANLGDDQNAEYGDMSLKELAEIKGLGGLGVERDKYYSPSLETK